MLVEINLLPKKEPKNIALLFWAGILAGASAIFLIVFFIALHQTKQDLAAVNQQIKQTEALQAAEQAAQKSNADIQDFKKLSSAVKWASDTPVKTVPVLDKLTKLLPQYGYITDFSCGSTGANVTVQFDSSDEAVYFLKRLNDSQYFSGAVLDSIKMNTETAGASSSGTAGADNVATGEAEGVTVYEATYTIQLNQAALNAAGKREEQQ